MRAVKPHSSFLLLADVLSLPAMQVPRFLMRENNTVSLLHIHFFSTDLTYAVSEKVEVSIIPCSLKLTNLEEAFLTTKY